MSGCRKFIGFFKLNGLLEICVVLLETSVFRGEVLGVDCRDRNGILKGLAWLFGGRSLPVCSIWKDFWGVTARRRCLSKS